MPTLVEELSARSKTLPSHDRASLAEELLDSLQGDWRPTIVLSAQRQLS